MSFLTLLKSAFLKLSALFKPTPIIQIPPKNPTTDYLATPWMDWMKKHMGETEITGDTPTAFNEEIFSHTGFGRLNGKMQPGCAATVCAALEETGYKSSHDASAISYRDYGQASPLVPGCICVFQWDNGEHHVSFFLEDSVMGLGKFLGGNQNHHLQVSTYLKKYLIATRWPVKS